MSGLDGRPKSTPLSWPSLGRANREGGRIAIFSPNLLLTIAIESRGEGSDEIHLHAGGQGIWVARTASELGANPVICGLIGGETGAVLEPLLERLPGRRRLVRTETAGGCHIFDRRRGERELVSRMVAEPPSRHQRDDLFSLTCAEALESELLVICNPDRPDAWPLDVYASLASDVGDNGTPVLVDLSSPRLDSALEGSPHLVKINDWELAEFVSGPVDGTARLLAAAERLRERGAANVIITRGRDPALVLHGDSALWLEPPRFERGSREGCGDTMMGALAAGLALGRPWEQALVTAAAAGAVNFLRHGLGSGRRSVIEEVAAEVELRPI
jgi:1-phosphofructokinase